MHPGDFKCGSGHESFLQTSLASLFLARIDDVMYTGAAGNASSALALTKEIDLGWLRYGLGRLCAQGKSHLIVIEGNMTAVRYKNDILRPVAVPLVQQRQLILQQDNAQPYVARVCRDFLANNNIIPPDWPPYSPDLSPKDHLWDDLDRRVRKRQNPQPPSHN